MSGGFFSDDFVSERELVYTPGAPITDPAAVIEVSGDAEVLKKGEEFADEIDKGFVSDFEKSEELVKSGKADAYDRMAHVSTFAVIGDTVYMTYYANTK